MTFKHLKQFEGLDFNKINTAAFSPGFLEYYEALRDTGLFMFQQTKVSRKPCDHLIFVTIDESKDYSLEKFQIYVEDDNMGDYVQIECCFEGYHSKDECEIEDIDAMFRYIMRYSNVLIMGKEMTEGSKELWKILLKKNPKYIQDCPIEIAKDIDFSLKPLAKTGIFSS